MAFKVADRVWETTTTSGTAAIALGGAKNGSTQTLSSVLSNGDEFYYCVTDNSTVWEVGLGTFNTGTPDTITRTAANVIAGSSGAGALITLPGTSCDVFLTAPAERTLVQGADGGTPLAIASSKPATPPSGYGTLVASQFGTCGFPAWLDSEGELHQITPVPLGGNAIAIYANMNNGTPTVDGGIAYGLSTSGSWANQYSGIGSPVSAFGGVKGTSASTAGAFTDIHCGGSLFALGTGGANGFIASIQFAVLDAATVSGAQHFAGLNASSTLPAAGTEPSTLTNSVGVGQISTDSTQWYFCYGGTTAQTAIALGTALGAPGTSYLYHLVLYSPKNQSGVLSYYIKNLDLGTSASGTIVDTTGVKLPSGMLGYQIWRSNNAVAAAVSFGITNNTNFFQDF